MYVGVQEEGRRIAESFGSRLKDATGVAINHASSHIISTCSEETSFANGILHTAIPLLLIASHLRPSKT